MLSGKSESLVCQKRQQVREKQSQWALARETTIPQDNEQLACNTG